MSYYRIDPLKVDVAKVTSVMSYAYASRFRILPVQVNDQMVVVATSEPFVREWVKELSHVLRRKIRRVIANPAEISRYLDEFYGLSKSIREAVTEKGGDSPIGITNLEQLVELGRSGKLDANDQHVVSIVDWLLQYAFEQRASDIHIEPRREAGKIRFRIDGVLHLVYEMPAPVMAAVTSRVKALGRMDVVERRRPQDGRVKTRTPKGGEVELRLSTMPTAFGEKLVMRIFNPDVLVRDFRQLGFSRRDVAIWNGMTAHNHGIILVTGPTGSGKTTTLYSTLKQLAKPEVNVCTVEDPIEMVEPSFNQMQVQHNIGLDFASGVRTLLRQDPDVIMVGEIRDIETARMAIQAALTGHLVLSTLHTNDSVSAITRLMEIGVPAYLIRATLLGVMAQRLVRTLCPHCKEPGELDHSAWEALVRGTAVEKPTTVMRPVGCDECRKTGFLGRLGLYEMLPMTPTLKSLFEGDCDLRALQQQARNEGLEELRVAGARKVAEGVTTLEEVFKVAAPTQDE
jgi:general secretion pathway protein E